MSMNPPTPFDGTKPERLGIWVADFGAYLAEIEKNAEFGRKIITRYLSGTARDWFEAQDKQTRDAWSLDTLFTSLQDHFKVLSSTPLARDSLYRLRLANGDLEGYVASFFALANQVPAMSEEDKAFAFAVGLGSPLYAKVWEKEPKTLVEAIRLARVQQGLHGRTAALARPVLASPTPSPMPTLTRLSRFPWRWTGPLSSR